MKKDFVSYNQQLALKELGFNEPCIGFYNIDLDILPIINEPYTTNSKDGAILFSQAFRFFEDKKRSYASILNGKNEEGAIYFYYEIVHYFGIDETRYCETPFLKREEAESACLDKLIEIAKTNVWEKQTNLNRLVD